MAYFCSELITRAYYLSRIVSRGLQSLTDYQIADGLYLLNALFDIKSVNTRLIPYFTEYDGVFVPNQELYFIQNLCGIETMTFNIQTVRYPMTQVNRKNYFGTARVDNIASLPFNYHVEREENGSNVYVYYLPLNNYPFKIWGKFGLTNVTLTTDLSLVYDKFYIEYMRYALADYICDENGVSFAPQSKMRLKQLEKILLDVSTPDLTLQKISTLQDRYVLNYAQANIGVGWTP
jgi:hypothetical protein